ncbi:hypothetical protein L6164_020464 [Bauhinia variegata]|uniref:Uncharacterized protein n=1 Tax=Bauhinia variegata TaxID=167791 RepID=A0ACB9MVI7_BAUVA|nr:hypothetical protein L6164_020464 [Bauhinia variegata]
MESQPPIEIDPPQILQSLQSDSVLAKKPFDGASQYPPLVPVSEETFPGSSPRSNFETLDDASLVPTNEMGSSLSLPTEDQDDQSLSLSPSKMDVSFPSSLPTSLDGNPLFSQFTRRILGESLSSASEEIPNDDDPLLPLVPQSSTADGFSTPKPTAANDNYYSAQCDSGRGAQEGPEHSSPYKLNGVSDYSVPNWSSHSTEDLSSSEEWLSSSSSSAGHFKEEWDSGFTHEASLLPSEDTRVRSTNAFSSSSIVPSMLGGGLANLGNTCFINAILQCFTHTVPLILGLCSCSHSVPCDNDTDGFCVLCGLSDHIRQTLAASGKVLSPWSFVNNLNQFSSSFRRYQQEDAHEFMQCVLDKLDKCFVDLKKKNQSCEQDCNLVEKVFGGRLISKLRCCNCGHCSETYEPLIDLSLGIQDVDNLPSALESFTKVETLDAKFICDGCKGEVSMEKQFMLDQVPSVAALHLKRFETYGSSVEKIDKHVDFPMELDLQPYTISSQDYNVELKYNLYAIVVHTGFSLTSGHYFCLVRSAPDMWHRLDDSEVTSVQGDYVQSQEAYILFYAKQSTPWFSSIMEDSRLCLDPSILSTSPKSVLDAADSLCNSHSSETNIVSGSDTKNFPEALSDYSFGGRSDALEVDDIVDAYGPGQFPSRLNQENAGHNGSRHVTTHTQMPCRSNVISNGNSCNEKNGTLSSPDQYIYRQEVVNIREDGGFHPLTPLSSPSPDAYSPDMNYYITRNHLKMEDHDSHKRPFNKSTEDSKRKEAIKYAAKSMPVSRRRKLLDAMMGPLSEGSLNKRRKRMDLSLCKKGSPPRVGKKSNHVSVVQGPVMA